MNDVDDDVPKPYPARSIYSDSLVNSHVFSPTSNTVIQPDHVWCLYFALLVFHWTVPFIVKPVEAPILHLEVCHI